jgi:soluble lytic murein transglycosylase
MATLPDVAGSSRSQGARPSLGVASYEPPQVGGAAAQAMRQGGAELQQAADIIAATNARQDEVVAQSKINALDQDVLSLEFDTEKGYRSARESAAVGATFLESYQARFDDSRKRMRESLSPTQQRIFDKHADVRATRFKAGLLSHQAQETDRFNDTTSNASITNGLQRIAVDPDNELTFQGGLEQIRRTVAETAARKGWGKEQVDSVGAKFYDAAYSTRITSILHGIPGVMTADPYKAEAMFKQVRGGLSPQAQTQLAREIDRGVSQRMAFDGADAATNGLAPLLPQHIAPAAVGQPLAAVKAEDLTPVVLHLESRGNRYGKDGQLLTSSAGAQGEMQVMPQTMMNPGYGIRPVQLDKDGKPVPDDIARVGRDLLGQLTARLGHPALVLAAYNAGEGRVNDWLKAHGDPRSSGVNTIEWAKKIPFKETREYVLNGLAKLGAAGEPSMPTASPTPEQLKLDLTQRVEYMRQWAQQVRPGNVEFVDAVTSRVIANGNRIIEGQVAQQRVAHDTLWQAAIGSRPDGSDRPASIDQMLASTQARQAWGQVDVGTRKALQDFFTHTGDKWTPESERLYHQLLGRAMDDPEGFSSRRLTDLSQFIGRLPRSGLTDLLHRQASLNTREQKEADANMALRNMLSEAEPQLAAVNLGQAKAKGDESVRVRREVFLGQLTKSVDAWREQNGGKRPQGKDLQGIVATLLQQGTVPGSIFGRNEARAFEAAGKPGFSMSLPADPSVAGQLRSKWEAKLGKMSDAQFQDYYTQFKLAGGVDPAPLTPVRRVTGKVTEGDGGR